MAEEKKEEKQPVETVREDVNVYRKKLIFFLASGVLIALSLIGTLIYLFVSGAFDESPELSELEAEFRASMQREIVQVTEPIYVKTQKYAVNLRDGRHYLQLNVVFVLQDIGAQAFLERWKPVVDDIVITTLKKESIDSLRTRSGLELLKRSILRQANQFLVDEYLPTSIVRDRSPVKDVLFTNFILN